MASSAHIHAAAYGHNNVQPNSNSNRMSVDDILNSSKFKGGRRPNKKNSNRSSISAIKRKSLGDNNAQNTGPVKAVITKNKVTSYKNNDIGGHANSSTNSKHQAVVDVNGREERRERLERLQQEQLQQKRVQGKGGALRRETSLDRVKRLEEEEKGGLLSQDMPSGEPLDDDAISKSSRGSSKSSGSSSKKDKLREEVLSGKKSLSTMGDSSSSRRSKRAKTVAKNDIISTEITMSVKNVPSQTSKGDGEASRDNFTPEEEVEEEPDNAQSALHSLLVKYTCIENSIGVAAINPNPSLSSSSLPSWDVVQLLVSVLRYINLLDPTTVNSQECKEVEASLAGVLKSVDRMKWEVMNRNNIIQGSAEDDDVLVTKNDARLLTMIQLQVWMRMMVWSLEDCTGWEFLERVIALADAKHDSNKDSGKKLKGNKKKKKSKKKGNKASSNKKSSQTLSPRDSLVQDVRLLMELAPYVLPPSLDFSQWLKDTLTYGFRQSIPEYGTELFDHFEIEVAEPIALKRSGTDTSQMSERSQVSHSPVKVTVVRRGNSSSNISGDSSASPTKQIMDIRHQRQQAYFASLAEEERASADDETATITGSLSTVTSTSKSAGSVREKDDTILLKTSVSLTSAAPAQTSNPFLKGSARGSYVGSHLSSKLSNITSLFREVKAAPKPKKAPPAKVISKAVEPKKKNNPSLPWKVNNVTSTKAPPPASVTTKSASVASKRKFTAMSSASRMTRLLSASPPKETPYKRPRPGTSSFRHVAFAVGETPSRQIVEETPIMKNQPVSARQRLRFRDDNPYVGNSIVAETPLGNNNGVAETPQQKSILRGGRGGPAPTNLWNMQHSARRSGKSKMDTRRQHHRQFGRNGNFSTGQEHLSPVVNPFTTRTSGALNYGLSPMPHQEDMASVLAKAAKSAASRKRK